jgi:hypothetical protein
MTDAVAPESRKHAQTVEFNDPPSGILDRTAILAVQFCAKMLSESLSTSRRVNGKSSYRQVKYPSERE